MIAIIIYTVAAIVNAIICAVWFNELKETKYDRSYNKDPRFSVFIIVMLGMAAVAFAIIAGAEFIVYLRNWG